MDTDKIFKTGSTFKVSSVPPCPSLGTRLLLTLKPEIFFITEDTERFGNIAFLKVSSELAFVPLVDCFFGQVITRPRSMPEDVQ
jgi:hypothetical protein